MDNFPDVSRHAVDDTSDPDRQKTHHLDAYRMRQMRSNPSAERHRDENLFRFGSEGIPIQRESIESRRKQVMRISYGASLVQIL